MYINWKRRQLILTLVLYGPSQSGKTTAWQYWAQKALQPPGEDENTIRLVLKETQGKQIILNIRDTRYTENDPTSRRVGLYGVDGLIFVADLTPTRLQENQKTFQELQENLETIKKSIYTVPIVLQYNKADLPDALPLTKLQQFLNRDERWPYLATSALSGAGLVEVLKFATDAILLQAMQQLEIMPSFLTQHDLES